LGPDAGKSPTVAKLAGLLEIALWVAVATASGLDSELLKWRRVQRRSGRVAVKQVGVPCTQAGALR